MKKAYNKLVERVDETGNLLCIGLDPVIEKLPEGLSNDVNGIKEFCISIINSTKDLASSYKINFAFFESFGTPGYAVIEDIMDAIPDNVFTIADAKRGDIGNTSKAYAKSFFEYFSFDSVTVAPYMGYDSVGPFLEFDEKMVFLLALTSNPGSKDFQKQHLTNSFLYQKVLAESSKWADHQQLGYVVGATNPNELEDIRNDYPDRVLLIPGLGAQGGDAEKTLAANRNTTSLFNVSRGIIYSFDSENYENQIREKAIEFANILKVNNDSQ